MFEVIFICRNIFLRIAGKITKIAKIRTRKNFVPQGVNFSAGPHKEEKTWISWETPRDFQLIWNWCLNRSLQPNHFLRHLELLIIYWFLIQLFLNLLDMKMLFAAVLMACVSVGRSNPRQLLRPSVIQCPIQDFVLGLTTIFNLLMKQWLLSSNLSQYKCIITNSATTKITGCRAKL